MNDIYFRYIFLSIMKSVVTAVESREKLETGLPGTGHWRPTPYAPELTSIAGATNIPPAWFGPLVPADFWAFDSMRRGPTAKTMQPKTVKALGQRVIPASFCYKNNSCLRLFDEG